MAMESISVSHTIFATNQRNPFRITPIVHSGKSFHSQPARFRFGFISSYKKSDFQDFQGFAKPSRLLPSTELKVCTETSKEKILPLTGLNVYKVRLQTSNMYGSSLSNMNAGILLCLIDEKGESILQNIPAYLLSEQHSTGSENTVEPETLYFQGGSVDELSSRGWNWGRFNLFGSVLNQVTPSATGKYKCSSSSSHFSGQWRLGGVSLIILNTSQSSSGEDDKENTDYVGAKYDFEVDDILLGESGDESMAELRPRLMTQLSGPTVFMMVNEGFSQSTSALSDKISIEKSMKEYADLKFSLLLYDSVLILAGTSFASFSIGESSAFAFLLGGIIGFLYLLLLQRSVDGLPASELISNNCQDELVRFRGPVSSLALVIALSSLAIKYSIGEFPFVSTPKELLVGMMGFLVCKVAVLLAAFKPLPVSSVERK